MTLLGLYLHMRVFIAYTLCMYKTPISMNDRKNDKINYERIRDGYIKQTSQLPHPEQQTLRLLKSNYDSVARELRSINVVKECKKCDKVKPARVRHCKTCEQCVIRMDHHCVLVNNCVGLHNHIYLIQLMFHLSIGSLYYFVMLYQLSQVPNVYVRLQFDHGIRINYWGLQHSGGHFT